MGTRLGRNDPSKAGFRFLLRQGFGEQVATGKKGVAKWGGGVAADSRGVESRK